MKIKVLAHTDTSRYSWRVVAEIDAALIGALTNNLYPDLPEVGDEIDISEHVQNMRSVNSRFKKLTEFSELLDSLTEKQKEQKGNG